MAERQLPSPEVLRQLLNYDPLTGEMRWKERPLSMFDDPAKGRSWNSRRAGKLTAEAPARGYRRVVILNQLLLAHRVAWAMHHDYWPTGSIDHINGDTCDNRIANLRLVDAYGNARNLARSTKNRSGVLGVFQDQNEKWCAQIKVEGRSTSLGRYETFPEAVAARSAAEKVLGYHENHGKRLSRNAHVGTRMDR